MKVWRICRAKYAASAFSGFGSERTGGRWNYKGHSVVYASENLSLAALELFVHLSPGIIPADLISVLAILPDAIAVETLTIEDLPNHWRDYPAPIALQEIGTDWLKSRRSLAMIVPSAINPLESNILINPLHADYGRVRVQAGQPFHFDPRMFGK